MPAAAKAGPKPLPPATGLVGLARALVQHGHLDEPEARALLQAGGPRDFNFVGQLTGTGRLKPREVAEFASRTFGYPLLDLDAYDPAQLACSAVDAKLMQGRHVLPLYVRRKRLARAVADPTRTDAIDDVKFHTGLMVDTVVVEDDKLQRLIDQAVASAGPSLDALSGDDLHLEFVQEPEPAGEAPADFEDAWLGWHHHLNPGAVAGTRDLHAPVAYVQTPVTAKPKSTCRAVLDFFGADHKNMTLPQLTRAVRASLHDHGTRALLLDFTDRGYSCS